ncbi:uncharacterized protein LOC128672431 [Plodia interpunctella]|uniref:uncharacterized protein LOC128672431 n=1 Tax=Plodia interpunctella TaxID=58824 RepID=UPI0031016062
MTSIAMRPDLLLVRKRRRLPSNREGVQTNGILIPSGKGKHPLLMYKKQTYTFKVPSNSGVLWHCSRRNRTGCKAFVKTDPDQWHIVMMANNVHCHDAKSAPKRKKRKPQFYEQI